nr:unnamed protein product [Callosobruchus analis]
MNAGLKLKLPEGCYGLIAPHSGLAINNFIDVGAGVVDADHTGETKIVLFIHAEDNFHIHRGDGVAQLICERILYPEIHPWKV